ncbi:hypothetical protein HDU82_003416 [Entophlyctis luteolus]|nr:hypothetical protein HDU82_003416 [Entophlyctis luteolus]
MRAESPNKGVGESRRIHDARIFCQARIDCAQAARIRRSVMAEKDFGADGHDNKDEELNVSFGKAYTTTLAPYHSFVIRPVFSMAMGACPYRAVFYKNLGDSAANFDQDFEKWLVGIERVVAKLATFYATNGIDKDVYAKR